jgi:hypothetical protein
MSESVPGTGVAPMESNDLQRRNLRPPGPKGVSGNPDGVNQWSYRREAEALLGSLIRERVEAVLGSPPVRPIARVPRSANWMSVGSSSSVFAMSDKQPFCPSGSGREYQARYGTSHSTAYHSGPATRSAALEVGDDLLTCPSLVSIRPVSSDRYEGGRSDGVEMLPELPLPRHSMG